MKSYKPVCLVLHPGVSVDRRIRQGVNQYLLSADKRWEIIALEGLSPKVQSYELIADWELSGVIGDAENPDLADAAAKLKCPFVNSSTRQCIDGMATVGPDDRAIGVMAGQYLADIGFQHLLFYGHLTGWRDSLRLEGFRDELRSRSLEPGVIDIDEFVRGDAISFRQALANRLAEFPRPIAVFASDDVQAIAVILACREHGIAVPEEIAILGAQDDKLVNEGVHPQLSSIRISGEMVGYEAAKMLDMMMQGKNPPPKPILIPPSDVVVRQSTSTSVITDLEVARGVRFIRENAYRPVVVEDVVVEVAMSRPHLERRFRKAIGRTIFQEIRRVQLDYAKYLLRETDLTLEVIAERAGLVASPQFGRAFRKAMVISPGAYRKQFRKQ